MRWHEVQEVRNRGSAEEYQDYIEMEVDRGKRRGGEGYGNLKLVKA